MTYNRIIFFMLIWAAVSYRLAAQSGGYEVDALRYSQQSISGSSRIQALGGAGVATGADISSTNINPAGLGLLKRSEFSISGSLNSTKTNTEFLGTSTPDSRIYGSFPNFGIVFTRMKDAATNGKYRGGAFGITYSKINSFQNQFSYSAVNSTNSIGEALAEQATAAGFTENQLSDIDDNALGYLYEAAFKTYLIDPVYSIDASKTPVDTFPNPGFSNQYQFAYITNQARQRERVQTKGSHNVWDFSYGGNYNDKVFFGVGVGISRINFTSEKLYNEDIISPANSELTNINISSTYSQQGTGINIKGGLIVKPNDLLRLGVSFQSPTYYSISETNDQTLNSVVDGLDDPLEARLDYQITMSNAGKITPGVAVFLGKNGFITAEMSYINYASPSIYNTVEFDASLENSRIQSMYRSTYNFKAGGEYRFDIFRLRAGFATFGDPYNNISGSDVDRSMLSITGGAGVRFKNNYLDLAIVNSRVNSTYQPYTLNNNEQPTAFTKNILTSVSLTFGVNF